MEKKKPTLVLGGKMDTENLAVALIKCAINGVIPEINEELNYKELFAFSKKQMVSAMVGYALESAGLNSNETQTLIMKSMQKMLIMENEKKKIFAEFNKAGIWYAPLKGMVLKEYYSKQSWREMADYDILFDAQRAEDVREIMEKSGYLTKDFGRFHHDTYIKQNMACFEMHRTLFQDFHPMYQYYKNVKEKLILDKEGGFGYHFSKEDFYLYVIAHENMHCDVYNGTGIRSLADTYLYLKKHEAEMDWNYIKEECQKIGITEFEEVNRHLAMHLFENDELSEQDQKMLRFYMAGAYGDCENGVKYKIDKYGEGNKGKTIYIFHRLFPSMSWIKKRMPFVYRTKVLIPFVPLIRVFQAITTKRDIASRELKAVKKNN